MPSAVSLSQQQYYAHQRNAFWQIMMALFNATSENDTTDYNQRKKILVKNKIAVWDVLQSCFREGSLDTEIQMDSITTNDFNHFFSLYPTIKQVLFNGGKAEMIFVKYVWPQIKEQYGYLTYLRLPSTSPAHARMTYQQKLSSWRNAMSVDHV
jgi:hypoxanthine-DNA glycosylase